MFLPVTILAILMAFSLASAPAFVKNIFPMKGTISSIRITSYNVCYTKLLRGAIGLYSCRDFLVSDQNGNELIKATSAWLTINLEKRRIVRLPQKILDIHPDPDSAERIIEDNFKDKIEDPASGKVVSGFRADYSTLDINTHVTSSVYIRWLLDALPFDFHLNKKIVRFEIIHKAEILPGGDAQAEYIINRNNFV